MDKIGFIYHPLFERHLEGYPHVECPERVKAIRERIVSSDIASQILFFEAEPAPVESVKTVHDSDYVEMILSLKIDKPRLLDMGDTVATAATPQAALHAAGAGIQAIKLVLNGTCSSVFCCVRPPGHHAEYDRAMGFCLFNNIAVAADHLLHETPISRVAIIDWDVHHGNGTENTFIESDRVLFISLHQYPHYPGSGHAGLGGWGRGIGYTINIPMAAGAGDREYLAAFDNTIVPALAKFGPEFILISAGFDAHRGDPLSNISLTTSAYYEMTRIVKKQARLHGRGRIVSLLEGGYNMDALAESAESHIRALIE